MPADDVTGFVQAILSIVDNPARWREMVGAGLRAAPRFSYERYLVRLDEMFEAFYGTSPFDARRLQDLRRQVRVSVPHPIGAR
jgi:hypothetical protein